MYWYTCSYKFTVFSSVKALSWKARVSPAAFDVQAPCEFVHCPSFGLSFHSARFCVRCLRGSDRQLWWLLQDFCEWWGISMLGNVHRLESENWCHRVISLAYTICTCENDAHPERAICAIQSLENLTLHQNCTYRLGFGQTPTPQQHF